jgi:hypothetical protein
VAKNSPGEFFLNNKKEPRSRLIPLEGWEEEWVPCLSLASAHYLPTLGISQLVEAP